MLGILSAQGKNQPDVRDFKVHRLYFHNKQETTFPVVSGWNVLHNNHLFQSTFKVKYFFVISSCSCSFDNCLTFLSSLAAPLIRSCGLQNCRRTSHEIKDTCCWPQSSWWVCVCSSSYALSMHRSSGRSAIISSI